MKSGLEVKLGIGFDGLVRCLCDIKGFDAAVINYVSSITAC